jgi:hypothetical protein
MTLPLEAVEATAVLDTSRDLLDYVADFSGLAGALLAAFAIWYASRQSSQSKRDLIRERRLEFELGLLVEIRSQMAITGLAHLSGYVGALIIDPSDETDLPLLRAAIGMKPGPEGERQLLALGQQGSPAQQRMRVEKAEAEVDASIQRRIEEA